MSFPPTPEQQAVIDAFGSGDHLVVEAGAGAGKTAVLQMVAKSTHRHGVYIAYNRSIAQEAQAKFPANVTCKTAHSLAFGAVGKDFKHRLNGPRVPAQQTARILGLTDPVKVGDIVLSPFHLARLAMDAVKRFCYSDADQVELRHVPWVTGLDLAGNRELARYLVPVAQRAWDEDLTQHNGRLRFEHDHYLKIWAMSRPQLPADYVLLDEAQDSNGCVAALVNDQDAQRIWVGDQSQSIFSWRGATDAMEHAPGRRLRLSKSFRFGPKVADEANKWLEMLDASLRLSGSDQLGSVVGPVDAADAVLCRTNAGAIAQAIAALRDGDRPALVGGGADIRRLAEAAEQLQRSGSTSHPELFAFSSWAQVRQYVEDESDGGDLRVMVKLIDQHTPRGLIQLIDRLADERDADLLISTAHKAKGREWGRVRIGGDFPTPRTREDGDVDVPGRDELMLAYVAVTRAREALDRGSLDWIDSWVGPEPTLPLPEHPRPAEPGLLDDAGDGYTAGCCRCLEHYTQCVCRLVPDRRRPASVPPYLHRQFTAGGAR